jgi:long-chain acyl-CoA synthetase
MPAEIFNLFNRFQQSAAVHHGKPAVIFKREGHYHSLSYAQLLEQSLRWQKFLSIQNIKPAEKVAIVLDNQPEFAAVFFAVASLGGVSVLLDNQLSASQISKLIQHSGAKLLVTNSKISERIKSDVGQIPVCVVDDKSVMEQLNQAPTEAVRPHENSETAVLFYTSGTTDQPKAVMLTHRNLISNVEALKQLSMIKDDDRVLAFLPLHHAYAFTVTLLIPLSLGITIVYPSGLGSGDLIGCLKDQGVSIFVGVPQVFSLIHRSIHEKLKSLSRIQRLIVGLLSSQNFFLRRNFNINFGKTFFAKMHQNLGPSLRLMVSGGARLDPDIAKDFYRWGFTILEGYGLTETSPVAAFNPPHKPKFGSVGKPLLGVEIRIFEPNPEGAGEVLIKGENVMAGYYQMPEETKKAIQGGWFYSGDLGFVDSQGYLFLVGRKKEMILLSNGKNVYPEDVEKHYLKIPYIKEIGILAGKAPGQEAGDEQIVAVIVPNEEAFRVSREANIQGKLKWELDNLSLELPAHSRIKGFVVSQEPLPRTRLGKLMRYQLNEIYRAQIKPEKKASPASPSAAQKGLGASGAALNYFEEKLKRPVKAEDHLELDLGLDSLNRIEMLMGIQERLSLELTDDQAMKFFMCNTVQDLLNQLQELVPDSSQAPAQTSNVRSDEISWKGLLHEELSDEMKNKIKLTFGFWALTFNFLMITVLKIIFRVLFLMRVEGRANLPLKGPFLICPNHVSFFDGLFVMASLPYTVILQTYFLGSKIFFEAAVLKPFMKLSRLIPIEATYDLVESLKACVYVLNKGKVVCYFPEGQRSIDGEVKEFKKGIGILIKELNVPVVPVYLEGAFKTWPRGQKWPRLAAVKVIYGSVIDPQNLIPKSASTSSHDSLEQIAENLRQKVVSLVKPAKA